ncbi:hypothetical protein [Vibrio aquaticus]|uniref:hypothetical protein n=1 Tax=Vibrio aquaticus TaxID=2496559 RepID=UPI001319CB93|nr:hypothetical protein [Vibrio aquaticus]
MSYFLVPYIVMAATLPISVNQGNFLMIANVYGKWMKNTNMSDSEKAWEALKGASSGG